MQKAILKLQELGVPPEGFEDGGDEPDEAVLQLWDDWVEAVDSIQRPVTWEEAEILIRCCPTDHMAGVEWTLLHGIESVFNPNEIEQFQSLIKRCNSDMMKEMLQKRLQNYIARREG